jgi:hypothetical protein
MRGRDSLADNAMWRWADEGVTWLNKEFEGKGLEFTTNVDVEKREVLFAVWFKSGYDPVSETRIPERKVLEVVEPIVSFVSHTTLTKIILIAG